jgi:hypothetical protein
MLAPLTDLVGECWETKTTKKNKTKKKTWRWDPIYQQAFDNVKAAIEKETVLAYPDFSKPFEIYNTDASTIELGAMIAQDNRQIAFFSRKLSKTQQKYSTTEIELLAIVKTLKEFKRMLWGQDIKVYTDHKNLTRDALGLTSDRVHRWQLLLEEYAPKIIYIKRFHNTVAYAISWLDYDPKLNTANEYTHATLGVEPKELSMHTIGKATMRAACQCKPTAFIWMKCLKIAARGQNIPSNNRGNCRSSTSWCVPEAPL